MALQRAMTFLLSRKVTARREDMIKSVLILDDKRQLVHFNEPKVTDRATAKIASRHTAT